MSPSLEGTGRVGDDLWPLAHRDVTGRPYTQPRPLGLGLASGLAAGTVARHCVPIDRPGRALHRTSVLELAPLPTAVPCARLHAVHVLHEWDLRALADDASLIVSELITNACDASIVLPDRPPIALRLLATEKTLVIEAWDQSPLDLEPREADADDECGRGLTVVAALADRWGCERTSPRRKVVWAELRITPGR